MTRDVDACAGQLDVSCLAFRMPVASAASAFALGTLSGVLGIIWIVLAAMFLYTMSVVTGKFEIAKESIVHIGVIAMLHAYVFPGMVPIPPPK